MLVSSWINEFLSSDHTQTKHLMHNSFVTNNYDKLSKDFPVSFSKIMRGEKELHTWYNFEENSFQFLEVIRFNKWKMIV